MSDLADASRTDTETNRLEIYRVLAGSSPAERAALILRLVDGHPEGHLVLPSCDGHRAMLDGVDLGREHLRAHHNGTGADPAWWNAERQALHLRHADLRGASLRHTDLQGALLEEADFTKADLAGANLQGADLAGSHFAEALLEDADLRKSVLRFAHGQRSVLEGARLQGADLWGAEMVGANLSGADLQGATLEEANFQSANLAGVDLRGAVLRRANLKDADLTDADLRGAVLGGANLENTILQGAQLQGLVLTGCSLRHVHTADAWLERTRLDQEQLGGVIGEELAGEYGLARKGYLALERNFKEAGDHGAESWAYSRRRRMEKWEAGQKARNAWAGRHWREAAHQLLKCIGDQIVEWVCDYGESIPRVFGTLLAVYSLFVIIYGLTGTVVRIGETTGGSASKWTTYALVDLAVFSLTAMTSPGNPPQWLECRNELAFLLCGIQTLLCIFLTGLLGFVAGNRIRR